MNYNNEYDNFYRPRQVRQVPPPPQADPWQSEPVVFVPEAPRKKHRGLKLFALLLAAVLLASSAFGVGYLTGNSGKGDAPALFVSDRDDPEVEHVSVTGTRQLTLRELYAANAPRSVSIRVTTTSVGTNLFGQTTQQTSAGSGFIITEDGFIITNYHVVSNKQGALAKTAMVTLYDGGEFEAKVIGGDKDYDIAVIKIEPGETKLTPVVIGDSADLQVGDTVAAIGNPLGELTFSMSSGIVSCVDRLINVDGTPFNMIQVDAAVNSGNSGGPLFNIYGEVVGIVSAKYSSSNSGASVEGLGFAIPINDVIAMVEDIMTNGFFKNKPTLSITGQNFSPSMDPAAGTDTGVYVVSTLADGAAKKAGLQAGDVIVKIGDYSVASMDDISALKKHFKAGDTVTVEFYRGGTKQSTQLTFDVAAQSDPVTEQPQQSQQQPDEDGYYGYGDPWDYFDRFFGGW